MPTVDPQLAAWLKSPALFALTAPGGVAWTPAQAVDVTFTTPIDTRADALTEAARSAAIFGGPNVKDRITVKGRRRDLLFKCIRVANPRLGYDLGPELVLNGNFDANTANWTTVGTGNLSVVGQRLRVTNGTSTTAGRQSIPTVPGVDYIYTATGFTGTSGARTRLGTTAVGADIVPMTTLTDGVPTSFRFTAPGAAAWIQLYTLSVTAGVYTDFDNVSLKEVGEKCFVIGVAENDNNTTTLTVIRKLA